ncbi:N-acetylmuramoyl-L-alanine amidase [Cyanobium sp. Cruz CV13-4-11]|jgi:N-acetylmuramoyl-L-alanine amidase|uniref:N-acetylmuramoyl-L-alanine amidase n=1 Tax=unclassified Cyanobium TaxID=2627006 RepID=UPI0020CD15D6|nr:MULTISPECIES: peptidoglycan recognition family protein [unclassified Cyanobium]MCP9899023.1 N-acetylmuramoyl-L-alanine amidase [Cyanobium sp. Cruz CV11-17]MCP9918231.1 N-acetylmuramoyl-L-alanine amidase [Cyanobium sp. Cruz CV13-4-11]
MSASLRPLVLALAGAGVLSIGGLTWLGRDLFGAPGNAGGRASLLDLLEEVRQSPGAGGQRQPSAPGKALPPPHAAWRAPLGGACQADPLLRGRLLALAERLRYEIIRLRIDPSNYGERFRQDVFGQPLDPTPQVVVLHETVYGINSAINTFMTPHPRDEDQVSYHTLIGLDGRVVEVLDPSKRAFGSGNSAFNGRWVVTNPEVGGSINNFSLHLSLETPIDGEDQDPAHSGYTPAQYDALAIVLGRWMRRFSIPANNITTHQHVDLGGERMDPRSFDWRELQVRLAAIGVLC